MSHVVVPMCRWFLTVLRVDIAVLECQRYHLFLRAVLDELQGCRPISCSAIMKLTLLHSQQSLYASSGSRNRACRARSKSTSARMAPSNYSCWSLERAYAKPTAQNRHTYHRTPNIFLHRHTYQRTRAPFWTPRFMLTHVCPWCGAIQISAV